MFRIEDRTKDESLAPVALSEQQQTACDNLYAEYADSKPHTSLLFGVTGSGKTSVFMKLIERVINDNKGIIVMVPEISLTPQFVSTFSKRFGEQIAVFHSALSLGERLDEYKRVKKGLAKIVIGTRSAVFAPFEKVGLIIMDEEQEYSYKSESSPRYHAREIAKFRCSYDNALLVLSSATPSVESYYYAKNGRYSLNTLTERYGDAVLPKVVVADMNVEQQNGNVTGFSETLLENLRYNLENNKQSILLLNRRGYNTFVTCRMCGEPVVCPNCSISLTYHSANRRMMCHYCGYSVPYTEECPSCHSKSLRFGGTGTQKAESEISELFPDAVLPKVVVADMNVEQQNGNVTGFSETLLENLRYNLENNKQSILLLNRRGYNTFVTCRMCGEPVVCPNCSISLTYHSANRRMMCHYCGYSVPYTEECPSCHSKSLRFGGTGTQKAESEISELFPDARILRMDTDATSSKSSYEKMITAFADGKYDILVGTQMVAKGLNFPNVTLVGVLNTDYMLYADDYRSYERTFSLLTQVVGRSGRGASKGMAVIQSYTPDNLIISMAARQDYLAFYSTEIQVRKAMLYPPFADICLIGFSGEKQQLTMKAANSFLQCFVSHARSEYPAMPLRILGPSPANVVKVSNKFRYKLIIKCKNNRDFRGLLSAVMTEFGKNKEFGKVSTYADMNALTC